MSSLKWKEKVIKNKIEKLTSNNENKNYKEKNNIKSNN